MSDKSSILYYFFNSGYFFYVLVGFPVFILCLYGCLYIIENAYDRKIEG